MAKNKTDHFPPLAYDLAEIAERLMPALVTPVLKHMTASPSPNYHYLKYRRQPLDPLQLKRARVDGCQTAPKSQQLWPGVMFGVEAGFVDNALEQDPDAKRMIGFVSKRVVRAAEVPDEVKFGRILYPENLPFGARRAQTEMAVWLQKLGRGQLVSVHYIKHSDGSIAVPDQIRRLGKIIPVGDIHDRYPDVPLL